MAKGRFISKEISLDKRVNSLSDSTSMLGFTWLITHLDCEGRTYGDPAIVKSLIFPRRTDITVEMVKGYIQDWLNAGLIILYESDDDLYIQFPNFDKHQVGLRKDREPASSIPDLAEDCRIIAGKYPAEVKLIKDKLIKGQKTAEEAEQIQKHREIDDYFKKEIKLKVTNKYTHDKEWVDPIANILGIADFDVNKAKTLIKNAVQYSDANKLLISSPRSLEKIIGGSLGKTERQNSANKGREFNPEEVLGARANPQR